MPLLALPLILVLLIVALIPISLVQRFRMGTARRQARRWVTTINLVGLTLSVVLVLTSALLIRTWVPEALTYTLAGLAAGAVLGVAGLALTRWETAGGRLQYTPNRWLVLALTLLVSVRVCYGLWRTWEAWRAAVETMTIVAASGIATSMSAGAVVLGYYLVYWTGVRRKIRSFSR